MYLPDENKPHQLLKAKLIFSQHSQLKRPLAFFEKEKLPVSVKGVASTYSSMTVAPKFADANFEKENQPLVLSKEFTAWKVREGLKAFPCVIQSSLVH